MAGDVVVDPVLRTRYRFEPQDADALRIEMWVDPGGGVTPHVHPRFEERFTVLSGRPQFLAGRTWREAAPGETVVVPAGTRHAFRNRAGEVAHMRVDVEHPIGLQAFLEEAAEMSRAGRLATRWALPRGVDGLLQGVVLARHHRETEGTVLLFPPLVLQRLLGDPLARWAERRGQR